MKKRSVLALFLALVMLLMQLPAFAAGDVGVELMGLGGSTSDLKGYLKTSEGKELPLVIQDVPKGSSVTSGLSFSMFKHQVKKDLKTIVNSVEEMQDSLDQIEEDIAHLEMVAVAGFHEIKDILAHNDIHTYYDMINDCMIPYSTSWQLFNQMLDSANDMTDEDAEAVETALKLMIANLPTAVGASAEASGISTDAELAVSRANTIYATINRLANIVSDVPTTEQVSIKANETGEHDDNKNTYMKSVYNACILNVPFEHQAYGALTQEMAKVMQVQAQLLIMYNEIAGYYTYKSTDSTVSKAERTKYKEAADYLNKMRVAAYNLTVNSENNAAEQAHLNTLMTPEEVNCTFQVGPNGGVLTTTNYYRVKSLSDGRMYYIQKDKSLFPLFTQFHDYTDPTNPFAPVYYRNDFNNDSKTNPYSQLLRETDKGDSANVGSLFTVSNGTTDMRLFENELYTGTTLTPMEYLSEVGELDFGIVDHDDTNRIDYQYIPTQMPEKWVEGATDCESSISMQITNYNYNLHWIAIGEHKTDIYKNIWDGLSFDAVNNKNGEQLVVFDGSTMADTEISKDGNAAITVKNSAGTESNSITPATLATVTVSGIQPYHTLTGVSYVKDTLTDSGSFVDYTRDYLQGDDLYIDRADLSESTNTAEYTIRVPMDNITVTATQDWIDLGDYLNTADGNTLSGLDGSAGAPYIINSDADFELLEAMKTAGYTSAGKYYYSVASLGGGCGTADSPYVIGDEADATSDYATIARLKALGVDVASRVYQVTAMGGGTGTTGSPYDYDAEAFTAFKDAGLVNSSQYYRIAAFDNGIGTADFPYIMEGDADSISTYTSLVTAGVPIADRVFKITALGGGCGSMTAPYVIADDTAATCYNALKTAGFKVSGKTYSLYDFSGVGTEASPYGFSSDIAAADVQADELINLNNNNFPVSQYYFALNFMEGSGTEYDPYIAGTEAQIALLKRLSDAIPNFNFGYVFVEKDVADFFNEGSGTAEAPFIIKSADQINDMVALIDGGIFFTKAKDYYYKFADSYGDAALSGTGTESDPFVIRTTEQLATFIQMCRAAMLADRTEQRYVTLANDVSAPTAEGGGLFGGVFDGGGNTISNLNYKLFDVSTGTVKNLTVTATTDDGYIAATNGLRGTIENCNSTSDGALGLGMAGLNLGKIDGCTRTANNISVSPNREISGIAGVNGGTISNCNSTISTNCKCSINGICSYSALDTAVVKDCTVNITALPSEFATGATINGICGYALYLQYGELVGIDNCDVTINAQNYYKVNGILDATLNGAQPTKGITGCTVNMNTYECVIANGIANNFMSWGAGIENCSVTMVATGRQGYTETPVRASGICEELHIDLVTGEPAISGCTADVTMSGMVYGAGLVDSSHGWVNDCSTTGTMTNGQTTDYGQEYAGLCRYMGLGSSISNCTNGITIGDSNDLSKVTSAAGLVGTVAPGVDNINNINIINCYNTGNIYAGGSGSKGDAVVGGLVGTAKRAETKTLSPQILNCYNAGKVVSGVHNGNSGLLFGSASTEWLNTCVLCLALDAEGSSTDSLVGGGDKAELFAGNQIALSTDSYLSSDEPVSRLNSIVRLWNSGAAIPGAEGQSITPKTEAPLKYWERRDGVNNGYPILVSSAPVVDDDGSAATNPVSRSVSITQPEGGRLSVSPDGAVMGEAVTVTVTPDTGKELGSLSVKGSDGTSIAVTRNANGTYSFTMPATAVTITAVFKDKAAEKPLTFGDVSASDWFYEAVKYCFDKGLMTGTGETQFSPDVDMSRAMVATVLWRMAGSPVIDYIMPFNDIGADQWYTEAVRWAAGSGITDGTANATFSPNTSVTREQLMAMLFRYAETVGMNTAQGGMAISEYSDHADISPWALEGMTWGVNAGVIKGFENRLMPSATATRAEIATIIYRIDSSKT